MNYDYIESLVKQTKENNKEAKAQLLKEFAPIINGYVKKFYIPGQDRDDLISECVQILLHAITKYDLNKHRFVSYGINAIKNNLCYMHRRATTRQRREIIIYEETYLNIQDTIDYENEIHSSLFIKNITKDLSPTEKEVLHLLFIKGITIREYARIKNINYAAATKRKHVLCEKIKPKLSKYKKEIHNI